MTAAQLRFAISTLALGFQVAGVALEAESSVRTTREALPYGPVVVCSADLPSAQKQAHRMGVVERSSPLLAETWQGLFCARSCLDVVRVEDLTLRRQEGLGQLSNLDCCETQLDTRRLPFGTE